jgi:hypothetical protein
LARKLTIEKVQKEFIKTLVDLQKATLETMKQGPAFPNFLGNGPQPEASRALERKARAREGARKNTKKQLAALKNGRQVLATKNRQVKAENLNSETGGK